MTQEEDNILIEQIIKEKDQKASNKFYSWYYKEVKTFLKKKYGKLSSDDIDDLSSDAISKSFINLASFDAKKSSFRTWLYTIAENVVIDYTRKLENRVDKIHYHYREDVEERIFDIPSNENMENSYSAQQSLSYATSNLDQQTNEMIKKKYVEGYSHYEIGNMYALTSSTVSNKINYAKSKIRSKIKGS
jgi:RNA polymerase sigma-70 factor (ECF subfamily)